MVDFICWIGVVSLLTAFVMGLATKWGIIEWLQVHAPNEALHELFMCKFCCSFWMGWIISLTLYAWTRELSMLAIPLCSTIIAKELW